MQTTKISPSNTEANSTATGLAATMVEPESPQTHLDSSAPTGFLDLPAELRNRIYELALPPTFKIDAYGIHWGKSELRIPGVLRVSRQIRQEALGIWLADTTFVYRLTSNLLKFLQLIGTRSAGQLKTVRLEDIRFTRSCAQEKLADVRKKVNGRGVAIGALEVQYWTALWVEDEDGEVVLTEKVSSLRETDPD